MKRVQISIDVQVDESLTPEEIIAFCRHKDMLAAIAPDAEVERVAVLELGPFLGKPEDLPKNIADWPGVSRPFLNVTRRAGIHTIEHLAAVLPNFMVLKKVGVTLTQEAFRMCVASGYTIDTKFFTVNRRSDYAKLGIEPKSRS